MGEEVSSSKGFFMTVAVFLALAMVASYFGDNTGQAVYRSSRTDRNLFIPDTQPQDRGSSTTSATESDKNTPPASQQRISSTNNNFGCETPWIRVCRTPKPFIIGASGSYPTEYEARLEARRDCEDTKAEALQALNKCLEEVGANENSEKVCKPPCTLIVSHLWNALDRPCFADSCRKYVTSGTGNRLCTEYRYNEGTGKRIEIGPCPTFPAGGKKDDAWLCLASAGGYSARYNCV